MVLCYLELTVCAYYFSDGTIPDSFYFMVDVFLCQLIFKAPMNFSTKATVTTFLHEFFFLFPIRGELSNKSISSKILLR